MISSAYKVQIAMKSLFVKEKQKIETKLKGNLQKMLSLSKTTLPNKPVPDTANYPCYSITTTLRGLLFVILFK